MWGTVRNRDRVRMRVRVRVWVRVRGTVRVRDGVRVRVRKDVGHCQGVAARGWSCAQTLAWVGATLGAQYSVEEGALVVLSMAECGACMLLPWTLHPTALLVAAHPTILPGRPRCPLHQPLGDPHRVVRDTRLRLVMRPVVVLVLMDHRVAQRASLEPHLPGSRASSDEHVLIAQLAPKRLGGRA